MSVPIKNVIVKRPCSKITEGITSAPELGKPDYELALKQHDTYIEALKSCGVNVTVLEADEEFPDSCFVEDTAVLTRKCAIISNPGAPSRNREVEAMIPVIKQFYSEDCIEYIKAPGTLEGGDVMMVGDHFYVGRSARTNEEGIRQFIEILEKHGLLKCKKQELSSIDASHIVSVQPGTFGVEVLVRDRQACKRQYPDMLIEPVSLEEIMLFYVNREAR